MMNKNSISRRRLSHKLLGEILLDQGMISQEQLDCAVQRCQVVSRTLGEMLVEMKLVSEENILQAFMHQYSFPFVRLGDYDVDPEVVKIIPREIAEEHTVFPVEKFMNNLTVAFSNPLNSEALQRLQTLSGCNVQAFVSTASDIRKMIEVHYS